MNRFLFWQRWLLTVIGFIIAGGILMPLLTSAGLLTAFDNLVNPIFWASSEVSAAAVAFQQWIYGLVGAVMAGWGISMAFLAYYPFRQKEKWAWTGLVLSLLIWYVADTAVSLLFGVNFNAVLNTIILALFLLPLFFTRTYFFQAVRSEKTAAA